MRSSSGAGAAGGPEALVGAALAAKAARVRAVVAFKAVVTAGGSGSDLKADVFYGAAECYENRWEAPII